MDWLLYNLNEGLLSRIHRSDSKVESLAQLEFFDGCSRKALAAAARLVDFLEFEPGTVLARAGSPAAQVLIVHRGTVEITGEGSGPAMAGKGYLFGEMEALGHLPHSATVIARGSVEVAVIEARDFLQLLDTLPCLALKVLQRVVRQPQKVA